MAENLYIGLIYHDTEERAQVNSLKRDVPIGLSDGFAVILDTQNQEQNAYYFSVNAYGTLIDGLVEKINGGYDFTTSWNAVWNGKTSSRGNDKFYEVAIPLKFLNFNKENAVFGIQLYVRDIKKNAWTILKNVKRNYRLFDLRFTEKFVVKIYLIRQNQNPLLHLQLLQTIKIIVLKIQMKLCLLRV